ncbi:uncharacterized protein TNCV_3551971 [Trichonephila clavipes]|nr:uncharacterized protein TNCV_3551971 [Trichonephila clavipes]
MAPHTITQAVGAVCRCKPKAGLRRSPGGLHTRARLLSLLRLNLDLSLKTTWFHYAVVQFLLVCGTTASGGVDGCAVKGSTRNVRRDPKCPSARRLRMVREDTGLLVKVLPMPGWQPMKQLAE